MKRGLRSFSVHEGLIHHENMSSPASKMCSWSEKSSNPWRITCFYYTGKIWAFSDLGHIIHIWPSLIRVCHNFTLPHTQMAQGKGYGLAEAIRVRVWLASGFLCWEPLIRVWTFSYAYGQKLDFYCLLLVTCMTRGGAEWPYAYETPHTRMGRR